MAFDDVDAVGTYMGMRGTESVAEVWAIRALS
jgi:hypothetical protein